MSQTQAAQALPMFFRRVVGIDPDQHATLRLDRGAGYGFAAQAQYVPLGLGEIASAAQHYPVLFTTGDNPVPVALLGLTAGQNLFVDEVGRWRMDAYVPAYVRAFPFIFIEHQETHTTYVGVEPDAACLRTDGEGEALFEDGKPTQALADAVGFCSSFRDNLVAAGAMGRALDATGLLEQEEATINFAAGGSTIIRGFKLAKPERLDAVEDTTFLDWRHRGWIAPLHAHLYSVGRWGRLIDLSAATPDRRH